jgi:hypothetical protein
MPTIKVTVGGIVVELEGNEVSTAELCARVLDTLEKIHEVERAASEARVAGVGGYL